ncbi:MAG TPA: YggS family pyridoxal phosphate-dependent enzyme [Bacillota bacterium]|nr:YggS family pyridoxal phosphate-dependent enzyme [Bacillota bacterium]
MDVETNLETIKKQIRQACRQKNRNPEEITLIAVTKYVTIERTMETIQAGITDIGENRLDGFLEKYESIQDATWHFIGTLQSRKVKEVINKVDQLHSLDRMSLAKEVNKRRLEPLDCFVQVNVSGEETKHGLTPEDVLPFIRNIGSYENIRVTGLMTMAPHVEDKKVIRHVFRELRKLRDCVQDENLIHAPCEHLSMGMSNDFEIAVQEGATHIRIGTKLVG